MHDAKGWQGLEVKLGNLAGSGAKEDLGDDFLTEIAPHTDDAGKNLLASQGDVFWCTFVRTVATLLARLSFLAKIADDEALETLLGVGIVADCLKLVVLDGLIIGLGVGVINKEALGHHVLFVKE